MAAQILPQFKARCGTCHNPSNPPAGLVLTTVEGIKKGGASGNTVVPKDPSKSVLVRRLRGLDGKQQMPMGFAPLTEEQILLVERWISEGASFETEVKAHWAYVAPVRPSIPQVKNEKWVRNPIDAFVLSRLEREGLKPSPEATKETLLRRVSLDLIGLPPTLEEIDAFLADTSPNAYEKVVERLLASPHYGERQARVWLDLARYADTNGYEADYSRTMWKWRDWVIAAYNKNMPFDEFTIEQIAGDMLRSPTMDQLIATGFHRNTMFNSEGGVDKDEQYFEVLLDRVGTTGTVWLGQTIACARCHDHKYDPFKQKEFYALYAFWDNLEYKVEGDHNVGQDKNYEPQMDAPSPEQTKEKDRLEARIKELEARYAADSPELSREWGDWIANAKKQAAGWVSSKVISAEAKNSKLQVSPDGQILAVTPVPAIDTYTVVLSPGEGEWTGLRLDCLPDKSFPRNGPGRASSGNFILSKLEIFRGETKATIRESAADFVQNGYNLKDLLDEKGDTGWAIHPMPGRAHELVVSLDPSVKTKQGETLKVVMTFDSPTWAQHVLGKFSLATTEQDSPHKTVLPGDVRAALQYEKPSPESAKKLDDYFRSVSKVLEPARKELEQTRKQLEELNEKIPSALILKEKPINGPLKTPLHIRGEWLQKGEMIEAGVPAVLPPLPDRERANRLSLADWLVSPKNPLTARVQVNRMWEQYFGRGIVETSDNFGTQGTPPSHPELLDWLATEFVRLKWDMKAMHRLIVTSATYRQSSNSSQALLKKDPKNELLARGPRFRMDAETIRDNALAASGLLNRKIGGPSVFPHQPDGIWNSPYNGEQWTTSKEGDLYRRGLYTFWKRTSPYPSFMAFDATSREQCTAQRSRTNTPLQSLTLMNDPAFLAPAKAIAEKMLIDKSPEERVEIGFRLCTGRHPGAQERARLVALAKQLKTKFEADPKGAEKFAGSAEKAAWTLVASTILNLDETITKG